MIPNTDPMKSGLHTPYPTATSEADTLITRSRVALPSDRTSIRMPEGWVEDTEFGKTLMPPDMRPYIDFVGNKEATAGYDPSIIVRLASSRIRETLTISY